MKTCRFPLFSEASHFTDDNVRTIAVAKAILMHGNYAAVLKTFARKYPHAGYGMSIYTWMRPAGSESNNSWGNGSDMRVSSVGFAFDTIDEVWVQAGTRAAVTRNHSEVIKGAKATALAISLTPYSA